VIDVGLPDGSRVPFLPLSDAETQEWITLSIAGDRCNLSEQLYNHFLPIKAHYQLIDFLRYLRMLS
jgi:hypothetical protein